MGALDAGRRLTELSIPGTHDAGARYELLAGTTKCQTLTIAEQLAIGIRYLDIRCRHKRDAFDIHHGPVFQKLTFDDVVADCRNFLKHNPTECVVMSVKEEYLPANNTRSFEQTFEAYVAKCPDDWHLTAAIPTLREASGKIVLFRRFEAESLPTGISAVNWPVDAAFTISNESANLKIQDQYIVHDVNEKWTAIQKLYAEASAHRDDYLYVNFTSGYMSNMLGIPNILKVSDFINPAVTKYFDKNRKGRFGITVMDFADSKKCSLIIGTNI
ncbi:MAG TPA: phosphatidylinositol-specific phospholipase C [Candidatus Binataceae bacterium]|nr:phosphatidylinositol-specific phospholipase C [Candidatus Binataceae bacterium]